MPALAVPMHYAAPTAGDAAMDAVGFPRAHRAPIETVAADNDVVIISRAVGQSCTTLIEEGYDTKGYRIHGKSTNWGPMAGFVVRDPKLSKNGVDYADKQEKAHREALFDTNHVGWRAGTTELYITDTRLGWLRTNNYIQPRQVNHRLLQGTARPNGGAPVIEYQLRRNLIRGTVVWGVWYRYPGQHRYSHMLAMVNPRPAWPAGHFKNAITGDYDLMAIWPLQTDYDPQGEDRRLAGMGNPHRRGNDQILRYEDQQMGNITNRVHLMAQLINSAVGSLGRGAFAKRNMCHHSDEGGRPFINDVDLPLVAFFGAGGVRHTYAIQNLNEMRNFADMVDAIGYQVILNAGWINDMQGHGNPIRQRWADSWGRNGVRGYTWPERNR